MNLSELKEDAKSKLDGKYGDAVAITLLYSLISAVSVRIANLVFDNNFSFFVNIIIASFFGLGYVSFFYKISKEEDTELNELWSKTNRFTTYFLTTLIADILIFLGTICFIVPGIILMLDYSMVYFIMLDHEEYSASEVLRKSREMMNGHRLELFKLELNFLGWMILGIFTFGILYLWLTPYMKVSISNFYNKIKEQ